MVIKIFFYGYILNYLTSDPKCLRIPTVMAIYGFSRNKFKTVSFGLLEGTE
jgi:hypothetical protein